MSHDVSPASSPDAGADYELDALLEFDTCKLANAVEFLKLRMRNEGYSAPGLRCVSGQSSLAYGYAVTSKVRSADPPVRGTTFHDLPDWWATFDSWPRPRIAVIEDIDHPPGRGAVVSNVHASVLRALGCSAVVTNGAVRNIGMLSAMDFHALAGHVAVSHAYIHMVEMGAPVELLGLRISPGELLCADVHGVLTLPAEHIGDIIRTARELRRRESRLIDFCRSGQFSFDKLKNEIRHLEDREQ